MKSNHVADIRKKTTQERLRGDHIELLYQLEDAMKINDQHEKEIDHLKELLAKTQRPDKQVEVQVQESGEVIDGHVQTIEALQRSVADLTSELKTVQTKGALTVKSHKKQLEGLQQALQKCEQEGSAREAFYERRLQELQEELVLARQQSSCELTTPVTKATTSSDALLSFENKCADLERQVQHANECLLEAENTIKVKDEAFQSESKKRNDVYLKQKSVILELEDEKRQINAQLSEAEDMIQELLAKLKAEQRNTAALLVSACALDERQEQQGRGTGHGVHERQTTDSSTQTTQVAEKESSEKDEPASSNQFKDYVQLKKENMTLKLQLAHKDKDREARRRTSSDSFVSSSSGGGGGTQMLTASKSASSTRMKHKR